MKYSYKTSEIQTKNFSFPLGRKDDSSRREKPLLRSSIFFNFRCVCLLRLLPSSTSRCFSFWRKSFWFDRVCGIVGQSRSPLKGFGSGLFRIRRGRNPCLRSAAARRGLRRRRLPVSPMSISCSIRCWIEGPSRTCWNPEPSMTSQIPSAELACEESILHPGCGWKSNCSRTKAGIDHLSLITCEFWIRVWNFAWFLLDPWMLFNVLTLLV